MMIYRGGGAPDDEGRTPPTASAILANWSPLGASAAAKPLSERCADAVEFLSRQPDQRKWLVVISDLQSRKFSTPLPKAEGRADDPLRPAPGEGQLARHLRDQHPAGTAAAGKQARMSGSTWSAGPGASRASRAST